MPQYMLWGYDDLGNLDYQINLDAWDDADAFERASEELATGGFEGCRHINLYRLEFVTSMLGDGLDGTAEA